MPLPSKATDTIAYELLGRPLTDDAPLFVWGHGWGQSREAFRSCVESVKSVASHLLIDFPGFGQSPVPPEAWDVEDYAKHVAEFLTTFKKDKKLLWIGHSFGGRVGIRLAAEFPGLVDGLFLIASHGLKPKRSWMESLKLKVRIYFFKTLKILTPFTGQSLDDLRQKFGSSDYRTAGAMRMTFIKVIRDDVKNVAPNIRCPTILIYGDRDTQTPPEMGERLARLIPGAELTILPDQDHYSILRDGRHPLIKQLNNFLGRI